MIGELLPHELRDQEDQIEGFLDILYEKSGVINGVYRPFTFNEDDIPAAIDADVVSTLLEVRILRKDLIPKRGLFPSHFRLFLDKNIFCYLCYHNGRMTVLITLIEKDLPYAVRLLERRTRLVYRLASRQKNVVDEHTFERIPLPETRPEEFTDRLWNQLRRDGTLKAYQVFDRMANMKIQLGRCDLLIDKLLDRAIDFERVSLLKGRLADSSRLEWIDFEKLICSVLRILGLSAKRKGRPGETDVFVETPIKMLIECKLRKRISSSVYEEAIHELERHGRTLQDTMLFVVTNHPRRELTFEFGQALRQDVRILSSSDLSSLLDLHLQYDLSDAETVVGLISYWHLANRLKKLYGESSYVQSD